MILPHCMSCKSNDNLLKNTKTLLKSGSFKQYYMCRSCNTQRSKRYRKTQDGMEAVKKAVAKYEEAHPDRVKAWSVRQRVKLQPCSICGETISHRHHPDVAKPNYIIFLCPKHHKEAHGYAVSL